MYDIILFDGLCNFCNFWVNFLIDRDSSQKYKFAALQSESGQHLLKKFELSTTDFDTFILIDDEQYFTKSTAALKIAGQLKFPYKFLSYFLFIPKSTRDFIYSIIANNRYKLFGKRDACRIPTDAERGRFL